MMKRLSILPLLLLANLLLHAEGTEHENILSVQYGGMWQQDSYLSPLIYTGQFAGVQNQWWQAFRKHPEWTHTGQAGIQGAWLYQPEYLNAIYGIGLQAGWSPLYNFQHLLPTEGLNLYIGPDVHFDFMGRMHAVNVNKPYSMDIGLDIQAHAGISYTIPAKHSLYRLRYSIRTSLFGIQYVPEYWQSYYELSTQTGDGIAGTSFHNKQSLCHELTLDMQFRHSAWRLGIRHEYLNYRIHHLLFQREQVSMTIGTVFNYTTRIKPYKW